MIFAITYIVTILDTKYNYYNLSKVEKDYVNRKIIYLGNIPTDCHLIRKASKLELTPRTTSLDSNMKS